MTVAAGFLIALAIAVTGVGGGTITVPVLILFLHVAPAQTVGTALAFAAVVKLLVAPVYIFRSQVRWRILALMLAGGLPGLFVGLRFIAAAERSGLLTELIGVLVMATALLTILRTWMTGHGTHPRDRSRWLPWLMLPVGVEMGFSSAGAGAIGSLALQNLTRLSLPEVAGTEHPLRAGFGAGGRRNPGSRGQLRFGGTGAASGRRSLRRPGGRLCGQLAAIQAVASGSVFMAGVAGRGAVLAGDLRPGYMQAPPTPGRVSWRRFPSIGPRCRAFAENRPCLSRQKAASPRIRRSPSR